MRDRDLGTHRADAAHDDPPVGERIAQRAVEVVFGRDLEPVAESGRRGERDRVRATADDGVHETDRGLGIDGKLPLVHGNVDHVRARGREASGLGDGPPPSDCSATVWPGSRSASARSTASLSRSLAPLTATSRPTEWTAPDALGPRA